MDILSPFDFRVFPKPYCTPEADCERTVCGQQTIAG
jgi:hypothetical protein